MPGNEAEQILRASGALLKDDHFVYISGQHGSGWIDKDAIFIDPSRILALAHMLAEAVQELGAEILCGPATGGLIVSQWTAYVLGLPAVFAEHDPQATAEGL